MPAYLTTLANVKAWVSGSTTTDDPLLNRLIAQASQFTYAYLQRPNLFRHACNEAYDGSGGNRLLLRQWPVLSVSSLSVGMQQVSPSQGFGQPGYRLEPWDGMPPGRPQSLDMSGYAFCRGLTSIVVGYLAGYVIQNEPQAIPDAPYQVTVDAPWGNWAVDEGVTLADGTPLVAVAADPAPGQYCSSAGVYTFNAADIGASILISYSFVPADIEQFCIEMVAERYRYKDRIGQTSKTLGGQETTAFSLTDMPDYLRLLIQPYRRVILC